MTTQPHLLVDEGDLTDIALIRAIPDGSIASPTTATSRR